MKMIGQIFFRDVKRIKSNVVAIVVTLGICIIPALYAWFNLAANWDPYGNTAGIKVAVADTDTGYSVDAMKVNIGEEIVTNLKENDAIGWQFVDKDEALEGVNSGEYYAAIIIPEKFSEDMMSFLTTDLTHPKLEYYVNEKKNAVAPKITDKGMTVIQDQVNSSFINTITDTLLNYADVASSELGIDGNTLVDQLVVKLDSFNTDLKAYEATIDSFVETSDSLSSMMDAAKLAVPDVSDTVNHGRETIEEAQSTLATTQTTVSDVTSAMGTTLDSLQSIMDEVTATTLTAMSNLETDERSIAGTMDGTASKVNSIIQLNEYVIDRLAVLRDSLPAEFPDIKNGLNDMVNQLGELTASENETLNLINNAAGNLSQSAANSASLRGQVQTLANNSRTSLSNARNTYSTSVAPQLNSLINSISSLLGDTSGLLESVDNGLGDVDEIFGKLQDSLVSGTASLTNTKTLLNNMSKKIDDVTGQIKSVGDNEKFKKLIEILRSDPDLYGEFMSSPVELDTTSLYAIENYGSAMTPFYTVLAIWVGSIVLVAIMKVKVDEDEKLKNIKPNQAYFGRYIIFFLLGQIQAVIICLGDLFFLKIQCESPVLFVLSGAICSFIFSSLIYTLVVSFGAIGKALAVIFLVLQLAGAGGTYPLEVLPSFFQNIAPYFPFTYGINAMRECVAGIYKFSYWFDILRLCCFLVVTLLLGLVLRKPIIKLTEFFERRLEDSNLLL
ncbi:MAG: YhgE/Pip domain-containing protein [Lachnospiraceae bacterium]|nr:YhgE/Pip domain-containing protein [Lachnospiraceae bacterium]MDD3615544.1 YhgE/Pip domain-containing protein [Lachnospiraceae bacterium]